MVIQANSQDFIQDLFNLDDYADLMVYITDPKGQFYKGFFNCPVYTRNSLDMVMDTIFNVAAQIAEDNAEAFGLQLTEHDFEDIRYYTPYLFDKMGQLIYFSFDGETFYVFDGKYCALVQEECN